MENQPTPKPKPTWLQILEAESWQAELIVSGAAIYGTLQLPGLVIDFSHYALLHFGEGYQLPMYFLIWYLILVVSVLIVNFIAHFILRALWIGTVGLASVFPHGIKEDSPLQSRHYLEQLRRDFSDLSGFNQRLDELCSLIFAFSFALALIFLVFTSWLSMGLLFATLLKAVLPEWDVSYFFIGFMALILLPSIFSSVLNSKALRDREWVKRIHYPLFGRRYGKLLYHILYEPAMYIINTFSTNVNLKRFGFVIFFYFFIVILISIPTLLRSDGFLFYADRFFELDQRDDRIYSSHYEDELHPGDYVIRPLLPSREIDASLLSLFIPLAEREEDAIKALCGTYSSNKQLDEEENGRRRRAFRLECLRRYYTIYLNEQPLPELSFHFYDHPRHEEPGVLTYIPIDSLSPGPHNLRIVYQLTDEKGKNKESRLPFWVVRE